MQPVENSESSLGFEFGGEGSGGGVPATQSGVIATLNAFTRHCGDVPQ
jgi:hypothetical protein